MKLIATVSEARSLIAEKYNLPFEVVEISSTVETAKPLLTDLYVREALTVLFQEGRRMGSNPSSYVNKIGLIKAVRTLSGCGLKEAKDFVEQKITFEDPGF